MPGAPIDSTASKKPVDFSTVGMNSAVSGTIMERGKEDMPLFQGTRESFHSNNISNYDNIVNNKVVTQLLMECS